MFLHHSTRKAQKGGGKDTYESDDEPSCQVDPDGVGKVSGLGVSFYDLELGDCRSITSVRVTCQLIVNDEEGEKKTGRSRKGGEEEEGERKKRRRGRR
jgi:hypothetical protein